jgi:hypothetical protein
LLFEAIADNSFTLMVPLAPEPENPNHRCGGLRLISAIAADDRQLYNDIGCDQDSMCPDLCQEAGCILGSVGLSDDNCSEDGRIVVVAGGDSDSDIPGPDEVFVFSGS